MIAILKLGCGLLLLIAANVALGSIRAVLKKDWNKKTFCNGLIKAGIAIGAFAAVYLAGWLNPELVVAEIGGKTVNLEAAVYLVLLGGFVYYAAEVLKKLKTVLSLPSAGKAEKRSAPQQEAEE